jgi:hypothetical protein
MGVVFCRWEKIRASLIAVLCVSFLAFSALMVDVASSGAAVTTPTAYRAQLARTCRSFSGKALTYGATAQRAQKRNDFRTMIQYLAAEAGAILDQNSHLESVPVPPSLAPSMAPTLRLLKAEDIHMRLFLTG